jgi:hypothetical protein
MSEWAQRDVAPPRVAEWLHVATGVVLFVAEREAGYGACIQAPAGASIDSVSIGDPETGEFERFDDRDSAVAYADDWKESEAVLKALEPGEGKENGAPRGSGDDEAGERNAGDGADGNERAGAGESEGASTDAATGEAVGDGGG